MEIKFNKQPLRYMRQILAQVQTQEQTQELKLPDGYPDIGRVLGCWGQAVLRGKEWRRSSMSASGGVMAWVMYAPEDGTQPRILDAWLPFQCRWDLAENAEDGRMCIVPILSELDGRNVSARKIILRAGVDLLGQAVQSASVDLTTPAGVPEDVQLQTKNYPMELPMEAGERQVHIEELLTLPSDCPAVARVISYELLPSVSEQKILANRMVFRGNAVFGLRYLDDNGVMQHWIYDIPFSDYTELDQDYDTTASAWIVPVLTALEVDSMENGQLQLRGSVAAQYTVFDRMILPITQDAFSPHRDIQTQAEPLQLPVLLDQCEVELPVRAVLQTPIQQVVDTVMRSKYPVLSANENGMNISLSGVCQILFRDGEGTLSSENVRYEQMLPFDSDYENRVALWMGSPAASVYTQGIDELAVKTDYPIKAFSYCAGSIPMITGLEAGERKEADPNRPSMILKRAGEEDLWSMAKKYGSTVEAIRAANKLSDEPQEGMMLLVPVC